MVKGSHAVVFAALLSLLASEAHGQFAFRKSGARVQLVSPRASVAETQTQGLGGTIWGTVQLGHAIPDLVVALDFASFPGDHRWVLGQKIDYDSRYAVSLLLGTRVGQEKGWYLMPALSFGFGSLYNRENYDEKGIPVGIDLSVGSIVRPVGQVGLDLGFRLAMTNLITQSVPEAIWGEGLDLELLTNMICLYIGVAF